MSDEDWTGLASITDVDGGAVIKFTGSAELPVGSVVPRDVSDNTFVVGDVGGSAIVRFLMNGNVNPPDSRLARLPVKAAQGQSYGDTRVPAAQAMRLLR